MPEKLDYKKEYKELYMPKNKPAKIQVPSMNFIMIDGGGDPNGQEYNDAVSAIYGLAFTIKMSKMGKKDIEGYFEYVVPPLEGLWWCDERGFDLFKRDNWKWTSMIRQPEFVTKEVFEWAVSECMIKKPELKVSNARLESFEEGLCVQMMHLGPYSTEPETVNIMKKFMEENGLKDDTWDVRKHHEIYLSDPRKTASEKLKTVLRHPVSNI